MPGKGLPLQKKVLARRPGGGERECGWLGADTSRPQRVNWHIMQNMMLRRCVNFHMQNCIYGTWFSIV